MPDYIEDINKKSDNQEPTVISNIGETEKEKFSEEISDVQLPTSLQTEKAQINSEPEQILEPEVAKTKASIKQVKTLEATKKRLSPGKLVSIFLIVASLGLMAFGAYFGYKVYGTANKVIVNDGSNSQCKGVFNLQCLGLPANPFKPEEVVKLKGQDEGRTNVLVVGADSAAGLSDTMTIVSYYWTEKKIVTLNLPRDIYINSSFQGDDGTYRISEKLNALYPFAERASSKPGNGAAALAAFITKEYGIPIHYWVVSNFEAVKDIVNELGGVDVNVDTAFTDCEYPQDNYTGLIRPSPSFKVGVEHMDGTRALIYSRSRHGTDASCRFDIEAGDFARGRRQSIVIQAIAKTAKSKGIFGNINNIQTYLRILGDNVRTNIQLNEMVAAYKQSESFDIDNNFLRTVWNDGNGILCTGPESNGGYNLVYCGGQVPGTSGNTPAKQKAVSFVQNLLFQAQSTKLFETQVAFLGNGSDDTTTARYAFINNGFDKTLINNTYPQIVKATAASKEKITVYIANDELRDLFTKLPNKPKLNSIEKTLPEGKSVPANFAGAGIIVWVESI
ncbi:MAG: LCP family protein [bacterium]